MALAFLHNAEDLFKSGNLAAFGIEQYCQLMVKYKLLARIGAYPRTNSLTLFLKELSSISESFAKILSDGKSVIYLTKIEEAYISSRYPPQKVH
jgi:HEPN domain-containing protein